ncbi:protein FAM216B [Petaurus breviceps papuanus]|uniref:protein FAM216B n=1 Tax=Petaurus breviceps papuanus TaxID=3040969 RepID=UPI0036D78631
MNQKKKKDVGFCHTLQIPGKQTCPPPQKPVSSFFVNPEVLKGLTQTQKSYLKSIIRVYDPKPQRESLKLQYIISLVYKYILGYISKPVVKAYVTVMDQYTKKEPIKCRSKKQKYLKTPALSSSRKSLSSQSCSIMKHCY